MKQIAELCNGSTADSDSVCWGSNPYSAAKKTGTTRVVPVFLPKGIRTTEPAGETNPYSAGLCRVCFLLFPEGIRTTEPAGETNPYSAGLCRTCFFAVSGRASNYRASRRDESLFGRTLSAANCLLFLKQSSDNFPGILIYNHNPAFCEPIAFGNSP